MLYIQKGTQQYWRTLSALFLGSIASYGMMYSVQPLIPVFSDQYGMSPSMASLAMSFTTGGMALSMLAIVFLSGFLDRKTTMTVALLGSAILTVIVALCTDFNTLLICRAMLGLVVAGFPAIAVAYINEEFEPSITGLVIGIYISGTSIGGLVGRFVVSLLTDFVSWQKALWVMGFAGVLIGLWFYFGIPKSKHFFASRRLPENVLGTLAHSLRNNMLLPLFIISFLIMGALMAIYNYIGYPLKAPPYNLSQTAIGGLFTLYLVGTFSSTFMGNRADRYGNGKILFFSISIMLVGALITLFNPLVVKIIGLAIFTFGFFGSHSTACSWVGKCCDGDKAQSGTLYLLFYYFGSSVFGTVGGIFLHSYGWEGVIGLVAIILVSALLLTAKLLASETEYKLANNSSAS